MLFIILVLTVLLAAVWGIFLNLGSMIYHEIRAGNLYHLGSFLLGALMTILFIGGVIVTYGGIYILAHFANLLK